MGEGQQSVEIAQVEVVLKEHATRAYGSCRCGWEAPGYPHCNVSAKHRRHVAEAIVAASVVVSKTVPPTWCACRATSMSALGVNTSSVVVFGVRHKPEGCVPA